METTRCGPCKTIAPFFSGLSDKYPSAAFFKVDVDKLKVCRCCTSTRCFCASNLGPASLLLHNTCFISCCSVPSLSLSLSTSLSRPLSLDLSLDLSVSLTRARACVCVCVFVVQEVKQVYQVSSMPTFKFIQNSQVVETFSGADAERLEATVKRLLADAGGAGETDSVVRGQVRRKKRR